jgi:hypothetical protein
MDADAPGSSLDWHGGFKISWREQPDGYFKIPAANAVPFVGMGTVAPYNSQPGGGFELMTGHPIPTAGAIWVPF